MGPKEAKTAQNGPKMTPNLVKGFPYVRLPYHRVFGPLTPGWCRSATTLLLKITKNGPLGAEMGPQRGQISLNWAQMPHVKTAHFKQLGPNTQS